MELWRAWIEVALYFAISLLFLFVAIRKRQQTMVAASSALLGIVILCFAASSAYNNDDRSVTLLSPDGDRVARIIVGVGPFLSPTDTRVTVRRQNQLTWQTAYSGPGWSAGGGEASHYLEWTDDTHLIIHYHGVYESPCPPKLGPVFIECRSHLW